MQYSSALLFAVLYLPRLPKIRLTKGSLAILIFATLGIVLASPIVLERLVAKAAFYELTEKPSASSGVALVGFALILATLSAKASVLKRSWRSFALALTMVALQLAAFYVTQITYAGIRFQLIFLLAQLLHFVRESVRVFSNRRLNFALFVGLWVVFLRLESEFLLRRGSRQHLAIPALFVLLPRRLSSHVFRGTCQCRHAKLQQRGDHRTRIDVDF